MASERDIETWQAALTRAALPGTASVKLVYTRPGPNEVSYRLVCLSADGATIGDDRDYDLLKAVMSPLEKLCDCEDAPFAVQINLQNNRLEFTSDK